MLLWEYDTLIMMSALKPFSCLNLFGSKEFLYVLLTTVSKRQLSYKGVKFKF